MIKIGDFSKLCRISIRMLRHYDEIGLLKPVKTDDFTGYRYYSIAQLTTAGQITALKEMGFSLADIAVLQSRMDDPAYIIACLEKKKEALVKEAAAANYRLVLLETMLRRFGKDYRAMEYVVTIKTLPERDVVSCRKIIPTYADESELWQIIQDEVGCEHLQIANPSNGMAFFHDKGYKEHDVDVEVQMTVLGTYRDTAHVKFKRMPQITYASTTYKGSYAMLTEVNQAVLQWVKDNGYQVAEDCSSFCIYHVSPGDNVDPGEYVTEVCFPVKQA